jgi:hypothetical protein
MDDSKVLFRSIAVLLFFAGWGLWWWRERKRLRSVTAVAQRHKLEPMDWELFDFPSELLEEKLKLHRVRNAFGGAEGEDFLLVFDGEIRSFRRAPKGRTVVARRYGGTTPPRHRVPAGVILCEEGKWRALTFRASFFSTGIMHPDDIERAWELLA